MTKIKEDQKSDSKALIKTQNKTMETLESWTDNQNRKQWLNGSKQSQEDKLVDEVIRCLEESPSADF